LQTFIGHIYALEFNFIGDDKS